MSKLVFLDPESGWRYGFPQVWDKDIPYGKATREEKVEWLVSKGYPKEMAKKTSIRSWEE